MSLGNLIVALLLRSPLHRVLSGSVDLVRYQGRRSGTTFTTPTQYAEHDGAVLIFVARPGQKTWWRNFRDGHDLDVRLRGRWVAMRGTAVVGADDPEALAPLLAAYLGRHPKLARHLPDGEADPRAAVIVTCRPRLRLLNATSAARSHGSDRAGRPAIGAERRRV